MSETLFDAEAREVAARDLAEQGLEAVDAMQLTVQRARQLLASGEGPADPHMPLVTVPCLLGLIAAGRTKDAAKVMMEDIPFLGARGRRSVRAALEAARTLYGGDLVQTIHFMNRRHYWLGGETPIEQAEQSEEGLAFILDMIGAIDAGVYL